MDCSGEGSFSRRGVEVDKVEDGIACVPLEDIGPPMETLSPFVSVLCRRGGGGIELRGGAGGGFSSAFFRTSEPLSVMISSVKLFVGRTIFTLNTWN